MRHRPFPSRARVGSIAAVLTDHMDTAAAFARHRDELHHHCARMLRSPQEAEDAVQDTFLRAWLGLGSYQSRASFGAWLYRIATNVCFDGIARRRRGAGDPVSDELAAPRDEEPDAVLVSRETVELALRASIRHLPARQHASLVLRDVLGLSAAETATALSLSVPATTSVLQRARGGLRRHLAGQRLDWATVTPSRGQRERLASSIAVLEGCA
jgi:RNA polymerase sigma-70 factor (ECF subfamily)